MQFKKIVLVIILLILVLFGAAIAFKQLDKSDEIKEQQDLVTQADEFIARELYIRGIPLYKQALAISTTTENEIAIERKLLDAYAGFEDTSDYLDLAEARIEAKTAKADEYLAVINYLLSNGSSSYSAAMEYIKTARTDFADDADNKAVFDELYEANRYKVNSSSSPAQQIIPTAGFSIVPALTGDKWGFMNTGKTRYTALYDSVTRLNGDGLAIVSIDGTYYTVNTSNQIYSKNDGKLADKITEVLPILINNCFVAKISDLTVTVGSGDSARQIEIKDKYTLINADFYLVAPTLAYDDFTGLSDGRFFAKDGDKWMLFDSSYNRIGEEVYEDVAVNSIGNAFAERTGTAKNKFGREYSTDMGIAMVKKGDGKWHAIDIDGKLVFETGFDNAKAPEAGSAYIAVGNSSNLWGYIDLTGNVKIDYQYYDAYSFSHHVGAVKLYNDEWVYISIYGEQVIENGFTAALPFHGSKAFVNYSDGSSAILTMVNTD